MASVPLDNLGVSASAPSIQDKVDGKDEENQSSEEGVIEYSVRLHSLAWMVDVFFICTFGIGAIVTYIWTNYDPDTDVVFRFFDVFSPCIFFDHYPANVVTIVGMSWMSAASAAHIFLHMTVLYLIGDFSLQFSCYMLLVAQLVTDLAFVNIFAVNLYPGGDGNLSSPGPGQPNVSSEEQTEAGLHTFWYILYLLGNTCGMLAIARTIRYIQRYELSWKQEVMWVLSTCAVAMGGVINIVYIGTYSRLPAPGGAQMDTDPSTFLQRFINVLRLSNIGAWHWVPLLFYRFYIPTSLGVNLKVKLDDGKQTEHAQHRCFVQDPDKMLALFAQLLGVLTFFAYLFNDPGQATDVKLALAGAFSSRPYSLFFTPCYFASCLVAACSFWLLVTRMLLVQPDASRCKKATVAAIGALLFVSLLLGLWLIIENFDSGGYQVISTFVLLPTFVVFVFDFHWRSITWSALWVIASVVCIVTSGTSEVNIAFNLFLMALLILFNEAMPGTAEYPNVHCTLSLIGFQYEYLSAEDQVEHIE